jgi:acetyltransferase-like isoleucine patch superfamily enzyme
MQMSKGPSIARRLLQQIRIERSALHLRLLLVRILLAPLPRPLGARIRPLFFSLAGFKFGQRTLMFGTPYIQGQGDIYRRLKSGDDCWFQYGCVFELGETIEMGNRVRIGHEVMILTTTHEILGPYCRLGAPISRPVRIEDGVWLCARCIVLPGVTVGAGAVVAAGAVVTKNVPPNTLVAGTPARVIKQLGSSTNMPQPHIEAVVH